MHYGDKEHVIAATQCMNLLAMVGGYVIFHEYVMNMVVCHEYSPSSQNKSYTSIYTRSGE